MQTTFSEVLSEQVGRISHSSELGEFDISISDFRKPAWYGPHPSGGRLSIYKAEIDEGTPVTPVDAFIFVLYYHDSKDQVVDHMFGYKIYPLNCYTYQDMFNDLENVIDSRVIAVAENIKEDMMYNGSYKTH